MLCRGLALARRMLVVGFTTFSCTLLISSRVTLDAGETEDWAWFVLSPAVSTGPVTLAIESADADAQGWSFGLCHDRELARVTGFEMSEELLTVNFGEPPGFYVCEEAERVSDVTSSVESSGIVQAVVLSYFQPLVLPPVEGGFPVLHVDYEVLAESTIEICDGLRGSGQPLSVAFTIDGESYTPADYASATLLPKPYAEDLTYKVAPPESNEVVTVMLSSDEVTLEGWSFALCHTARAAEVVEVATSTEVEQIVSGNPPEFVEVRVTQAEPFVAVEQSVVLGTPSEPLALGPFPDGLPLLDIRYRVLEDDELKFCDQVGEVEFDNRVTVEGIGYVPGERLGGRLVLGSLGARFVRGDADLSGTLELTDAVFVLMWLFLAGDQPPCLDAADANDIGSVDISDPIFVLRFLFLGGPPPPPPFPGPGEDLRPRTSLGCERGL